jgi:hypothetical protein
MSFPRISPEFSNQRKRVDYGRPHAPQSRLREQLKILVLFFCFLIGGYYSLTYMMYSLRGAHNQAAHESFDRGQVAPRFADAYSSNLDKVPVEIEIDRKCVPNYRYRLVNQGVGPGGKMMISFTGMPSDNINMFWLTNGNLPGALLLPREISRYFQCSMANKIERFCEPTQRKRLTTQLYSLLEFRTQALNYLGTSGVRRGSEAFMTQGEYDAALAKAKDDINGSIVAIGPRLRYLAQSGYISPSDFGFFGQVPELLRPYVVDKLQNRCG